MNMNEVGSSLYQSFLSIPQKGSNKFQEQ
jgi:hypothetical protein